MLSGLLSIPVHRGDAQKPRIAAARQDTADAQVRARLRSHDRPARFIYGGGQKGGARDRQGRNVEASSMIKLSTARALYELSLAHVHNNEESFGLHMFLCASYEPLSPSTAVRSAVGHAVTALHEPACSNDGRSSSETCPGIDNHLLVLSTCNGKACLMMSSRGSRCHRRLCRLQSGRYRRGEDVTDAAREHEKSEDSRGDPRVVFCSQAISMSHTVCFDFGAHLRWASRTRSTSSSSHPQGSRRRCRTPRCRRRYMTGHPRG